jgi:hypothetical protein
MPPRTTTYNLGFTAGTLRPDLLRIVAQTFIKTGNWEEAKKLVLDQNLLQYETKGSAKRMELEMRGRLMTLTLEQLRYLADASTDEATSIAWLAACKHIPFVNDFAVETLREKLSHQDNILRNSDYENYLTKKRSKHPELDKITELSKSKTRQVMYKMLVEAYISHEVSGRDEPIIQRPPLSYAVTQLIVKDDRNWLRAFLIPDSELNSH